MNEPITPIVAPAQPVLEARGLVKRYGHVTALDGADFELLLTGAVAPALIVTRRFR